MFLQTSESCIGGGDWFPEDCHHHFNMSMYNGTSSCVGVQALYTEAAQW